MIRHKHVCRRDILGILRYGQLHRNDSDARHGWGGDAHIRTQPPRTGTDGGTVTTTAAVVVVGRRTTNTIVAVTATTGEIVHVQ